MFLRPSSTKSGYIYLPSKEYLNLELNVAQGSYIIYTISWGDGHNDKVDLSNQIIPQPRALSHLYSEIGNFTLIVKVSNNNFELRKNFTVMAMDCTIPPIFMPGGISRDDAIDISSMSKYEIRASYRFKNQTCSDTIMPYLIGEWNVFNDSNGDFIEGQSATMSNLMFEFNEKLNYDPGVYSIVLTLAWMQEGNNLTLSYTSYVKVFTRSLDAIISEGNTREIAFKMELADGTTTYYDFEIEGNASYDPDEREKGYELLNFKWYCRIISNVKLVNESRAARMKANSTFEEVCKDFNNYLIIEDGKAILELNTADFLENVTYSIKLEVQKNGKIGTAYQELTFVPGSPPIMHIQ